ncbi:hypothetical protein DIS24_g12542 [Lasiodiplodia hormozganensis]|uniref:Uncharacterized protein n=1 Tax=Lasiodiplodia hormozganensis TaxID=869390 RepID=A0AA39U192_9PEZI|nr:hypothetical protein DIS24_g12542 [Lasiodiplodia hormozganensis]
MAQLRPLWLEPASSNLTTLVLYQSFYFGFSPKLDLRGLHIPNLRTLALGNYVFTHDWQLDWLSSHSSSLQNLYLDDCLVVFYALFYETEVDPEGYPVIDTNGSNDTSRMDQYMFFDQTWSRILGHFRTHLSSLRHFRMGKSTRWQRYNTPFHPSEYENLEIGIFRDRYQMFNMGIGPCQYTDEFTSRSSHTPLEDVFTEEDGRGTADGDKAYAFLERFDEQGREDTNALVELLNAIGQPLQEDIDRVEDLMLPGY